MAQKTEAFIFKLEKSEKQKLCLLAEAFNISQAATLRYLINGAAAEMGIGELKAVNFNKLFFEDE